MEKPELFGGLKPGAVLGERYRIVSLIGHGGMGAVFLAEDIKLNGKKRAVKETLMDQRAASSFHNEAELLMKLSHPYLPDIVDYFGDAAGGKVYLVMEYIEGVTMEEKFAAGQKKLEVSEVVKYALQLCDLLDYLHHGTEQAIVYRDLKPANVMIDDQGNVRLIDFGIARRYKQKGDADTLQIGTIGFAAPEQFEKNLSDERTDIYALGAMLYYFLSQGRYYYLSETPLSELKPELPAALVMTVERLLQRNPANRPQSVNEVRTLLKGCLNEVNVREDISQHFERHSAEPKLIVIAGLYPGAGSTFFSVSLARALHRRGVEHALIEAPLQQPELFLTMFGNTRVPQDYRFLSDQIILGESLEHRNVWLEGLTSLFPANPAGLQKQWRNKDLLKLLFSVKSPVKIVDVSHLMDHPAAVEMIEVADEIVVVTDPFPAKMNRPHTLARMERLQNWRDQGKRVHFAANRDMLVQLRKEWFAALPFPPSCTLPEIPLELLLEAIGNNKTPQDCEEIAKRLDPAISPFIEEVAPHAKIPRMKKRRRFAAIAKINWGLAKRNGNPV